MTQKAYPHRIMSIDQQKISQNHEIVFLHYLVKFLIWRPFSPINKLPINTQVKATVATNQNSSFNNPRTVTARWLHMHASMGPLLKSYKLSNHSISYSYNGFEFYILKITVSTFGILLKQKKIENLEEKHFDNLLTSIS